MYIIKSSSSDEIFKTLDEDLLTEWIIQELGTLGINIEERLEEVEHILNMEDIDFYSVVIDGQILLEIRKIKQL